MKNKDEKNVKVEDDCSCGEDCECDCCDSEMGVEELTETNNLLINAVIELLIRKNTFSRDEFEKILEEMQSESDEE